MRLRDRIREILSDSKKGAGGAGPLSCPGRSDCSRLDAVQLCKGCEFEKDSWGKWPETLDWSKVTNEAKTRYVTPAKAGVQLDSRFRGNDDDEASRLALDRWITHLFWLYHKKEAGCVFHLNDLTPREWEGLEIVIEEVNRITPKF